MASLASTTSLNVPNDKDNSSKSQKFQKKLVPIVHPDEVQWGPMSTEQADQIMSGEAVAGSRFGIVERLPVNLHVDHTAHKAIIKKMFSIKDNSDTVDPVAATPELESQVTAPTYEVKDADAASPDALHNEVATSTAELKRQTVDRANAAKTADMVSADAQSNGLPPIVFDIPHKKIDNSDVPTMPNWMHKLACMTSSSDGAISRNDADTSPCCDTHLEQPDPMQPAMLQLIHQLQATLQKDVGDNSASLTSALKTVKDLYQKSTLSSSQTTKRPCDDMTAEPEQPGEREQKRLRSLPSSSSLPESLPNRSKRDRSESPTPASQVSPPYPNDDVDCIMIRQGQLATLMNEKMYLQTYRWKESSKEKSTIHLILSQDNGSLSLYAGSFILSHVQQLRWAKEIPHDVDQASYWKQRLKDDLPVFSWVAEEVNPIEAYAIKHTYKKFRNRHFRMSGDVLSTKVCPSRLLPKGMSLYQTSHFFLNLLGRRDLKRLELTARSLDGCTIRVGTTCSGSDIGIIAVKSVLDAVQQRFQVRYVVWFTEQYLEHMFS